MDHDSFILEEAALREHFQKAEAFQEAELREVSEYFRKKQKEALVPKFMETHELVVLNMDEPEVSIDKCSRELELFAQNRAKWWQLRKSGHTYHTAAGETKYPRERCRELERWYQQEVTKETVEIHLLPSKAEAALIKAGRAKFMNEALEAGDSKAFAKMAALAIKDPALAMTQNSPKVVINVGDVKRLVDDAPPVEVEFSDD